MNPKFFLKKSFNFPSSFKSLFFNTKKNFYFQHHTHGAGDVRNKITFNFNYIFYFWKYKIHVVAKRVIKCVGQRLREYDPLRWESIPITYQTVFNIDNEFGYSNINLSIQVHDALEREFNIDIDDKKILMKSIEECVKFILEDHKSV